MTATYRRNVISNAGANALGSVVQFVLVILLARWLPMHEFAIYVTVAALVGVGEMLSDFGLRIWAQRHFAIRNDAARPFGIALATKGVFSFIFGLVLMAYPWQGMNIVQIGLAVLVAITQPSSDPMLWFLRGKERLDIEATVLIGWRLCNATALIFTVTLGYGINALLIVWLMVNALRLLVESRFSIVRPLWVPAKLLNIRSTEIYLAARQAMPIGLSFVLLSLYHRMGVFLIGERGSLADVALFGAVFTLVASAGFMATSITVAGFSPLSRAIEARQYDEAAAIAHRKLKLISLIFFPLCLVGMFVAPGVVGLLYPPSYFPAGEAVPLLLAALFLSTVNLALKYILNALKHNWLDASSAIFGIAAFVAVYMLPNWGFPPVGAAFAWYIAEGAVFFLKFGALAKDRRIALPVLRSSGAASLLLFGVAWFVTKPVVAFYREHLF